MKLNQAYTTLKKNPRRIENIMSKSTQVSTKVLPNKTTQASTGTGPVFDAVKGRKGYRVPGRAENLVRTALGKAKGLAKNPKVTIPAAIVGAAVGVHKKQESMKKQAAEKITVDGKTYRKGTVGSATKKMAIGGGLAGAALGAKMLGAPGAAIGAAQGALSGGLTGLGYSALRGGLRSGRDELSASGKKWDSLKKRALEKKAADLHILKDGRKVREGTVGSATAKMGAAGVLANVIASAKTPLKAVGLKNRLIDAAVVGSKGALAGAGYGALRGANRIRHGEQSMTKKELAATKKGLNKQADTVHKGGKTYQDGTTASAATKMAIAGGLGHVATLSAIRGAADRAAAKSKLSDIRHLASKVGGSLTAKNIAKKTALGAGVYGAYGAAYGALRKKNRDKKGIVQVTSSEMKKIKGMDKRAEEGTPASAAKKMAVAGGILAAGGNAVSRAVLVKHLRGPNKLMREVAAKSLRGSHSAKGMAKSTAAGAGMYGAAGYGYGKYREAKRGTK